MNVSHLSASLAEVLIKSSVADLRHGNVPRRPFTIAISRQPGALGNTVARALGEKLGWESYDQEILYKVAEEMKEPAFHVRGLDERSVGWFEEAMAGLTSLYTVKPVKYLKTLLATIRGLGEIGHCVIVGRGAGWILPRESTLHVQLIADKADRIKVVGNRLGMSDKDAARFIEKTEAERVQFVKNHFAIDPTEPVHYDLVLNTSRLSVDECVEQIANLLRLFEKRTAPMKIEAPVPALEAV